MHAELAFDAIDLQGAWSPDSKRLVVAVNGQDPGGEGTYLYEVDPLRQAWKIDYPASFVAFDPAGQHVLAVYQGLRVLDVASGSVTSTIQLQEGNTLLFPAYLPDGSGLILGRTRMLAQETPGRTEFSLWEFQHESLSVRSELVGDLTALSVSPDGKQVAASLARLPDPIDTRRSFTWRLPGWDFLCALPGEQVRYGSGGLFVSSTSRASIDLFDASTCRPLEMIYVGEPITAFAFHPESPVLVAAGSAGGVIRAYDLDTGTRMGQQEVNDVGVITYLSFSPDGRFLLALSANKASVWTVVR